jgi:hypothetical protein
MAEKLVEKVWEGVGGGGRGREAGGVGDFRGRYWDTACVYWPTGKNLPFLELIESACIRLSGPGHTAGGLVHDTQQMVRSRIHSR